MKLIDFIKKTLKEKGIDEKHADRILKAFKLEKEEDVAGAVDLFKDNLLPAITEAETKAQKDAEEATRKAAIEAYEKEHGLKGGKPVDNPNPDEDKFKGLDPAVKAVLDAQNKQLEEMKELLKGNQQSSVLAEKKATAASLIKAAELPEGWLDRIKFDSDVKLEDQVKTLGDEFIGIQQKAIDAKVASGEYTPGSVQLKDRSEAEWTTLMNSDVTPNNSGTVDLGLSK
ncbi:hypothetical protein G7050_02735 [Dysgonomonas sp. HDW5A]|uniref:hypothetical protein n=1 Tax=Dysgonomonas sp. HDW5A TaxID=2714926 RepID=UPI00140C4184|nr:hypothetical protein [Dysgonomonas sp. HDW5A]QIK58816.1 hypothetical protein G7050_02735 [Dysgonomonas sp. HDW5A]